MSTKKFYPEPGDLLEYRCPNYGIVWQWQVHSVHLGNGRQESLIEISSVSLSDGTDGQGQAVRRMWVPEAMTRNLGFFRPGVTELTP